MRWIPPCSHRQGTCEKSLQIPFSSPSTHSCLLSANNPAFMWEDRELYAGGLGRPGSNLCAPVKPVENVLLVPGTGVLHPLPITPVLCCTLSLSNGPMLFGSSFKNAVGLRLLPLYSHRASAPGAHPPSSQGCGQHAAPMGVSDLSRSGHFSPLSLQDQSSYRMPIPLIKTSVYYPFLIPTIHAGSSAACQVSFNKKLLRGRVAPVQRAPFPGMFSVEPRVLG